MRKIIVLMMISLLFMPPLAFGQGTGHKGLNIAEDEESQSISGSPGEQFVEIPDFQRGKAGRFAFLFTFRFWFSFVVGTFLLWYIFTKIALKDKPF